MEPFNEFMQQNQIIYLVFAILLLAVLLCVLTKELRSIFKRVECYNRILFTLSFIGLLSQIILFQQKYFEIGLIVTLIVSTMLFWLFINRPKIDNEEFNAFVVMLLLGQSAYCMIVSNQKELYDYEIFHSIVYAGIYIGIPMFIAYKFTLKEKRNNEMSNENIYEKLTKIENKLNSIDNSINKSYKSSCSLLSIFKRFK